MKPGMVEIERSRSPASPVVSREKTAHLIQEEKTMNLMKMRKVLRHEGDAPVDGWYRKLGLYLDEQCELAILKGDGIERWPGAWVAICNDVVFWEGRIGPRHIGMEEFK